MARQFKRVVRCTVGVGEVALKFEELKISFSIESSRVGYPNIGNVELYNLSPQSRQQIKEEGTFFRIEAGYPDNEGIIFSGNLRNSWTVRREADLVAILTGADGDSDFQNAVINTTLDTGSTPVDVIETLGGSLVEGKLVLAEGIPETPSEKPIILSGNTKDELDKVCRNNNLEWNFLNGSLEVVSNDRLVEEFTLISKETGMVGVPVVTDIGVNVDTLLNPKIRPNRGIKVLSDFSDVQLSQLEFSKRDTDLGAGLFRVNKVIYKGDNRDGAFLCSIEGIRVSNGRVVGQS